MRYNDVRLRKASCLGYFFILNRAKERKLYVCKGSYHFVLYPSGEKRNMEDILEMDAILSPFNIFVGHEYLQHAGAEHLKHHNLRLYVYLVPKGLPLNDSMVLHRNGALILQGLVKKIAPTNLKQ